MVIERLISCTKLAAWVRLKDCEWKKMISILMSKSDVSELIYLILQKFISSNLLFTTRVKKHSLNREAKSEFNIRNGLSK